MWPHVAGWAVTVSFLLQGFLVPVPGLIPPRHLAQSNFSLNTPSLPITNYQLPMTHALPPICSSALQLQKPEGCPKLGPGGYISQIVSAGLPYPFPALSISPVPIYRGLTPAAYAKIITSTAPVYRHPYDA